MGLTTTKGMTKMIVHTVHDLWYGCQVILNDGRRAEVDNFDTSNPEMVNVTTEDGEELELLAGEPLKPEEYPVYVQEIYHPQTHPDDLAHEDEVDVMAVIFDGIDPNTFDGDILDII